MIRFEEVQKHYRKDGEVIRALDGVTLEAPAGALTLVTGPSGSGKTTLINLAAGLSSPSGGAITVAGRRLDGLGVRDRDRFRAGHIAVVFQMFHLVPYLTALENVLLPTLAAPCDAPGERARELLDALGLTDRSNHYPAELSAGERQRCALARAVLHRPQVILADEPTGNLDEDSATQVLNMLGVCRAEGATVLIASHQHLSRINPDVEFRLRKGRLEA
jgi:putative ABC transport system ATP-binding protein